MRSGDEKEEKSVKERQVFGTKRVRAESKVKIDHAIPVTTTSSTFA